jgi:hypothetical protein
MRVPWLPRETKNELRRRAEIRGQSLGEYVSVHLMLHAREPDPDPPAVPRRNIGRAMDRMYALYCGTLIAVMVLLTVVLIVIEEV